MKKQAQITDVMTLEEAKERLPQVKKHLKAIIDATKGIRVLYKNVVSGKLGEPIPMKEEVKLKKYEVSFRKALEGLTSLGAYLKDPSEGIIDFYTWHEGELAFLCYHYGEMDIYFYHGLDDGYGGRKPIS